MPTTSTKRMSQIVYDLQHDGYHISANSVEAITAERDALVNAALPFCAITETATAYIGSVTPAQINALRDAISLVQKNSR